MNHFGILLVLLVVLSAISGQSDAAPSDKIPRQDAEISENVYLGAIGSKVRIRLGKKVCWVESKGEKGGEGEAPKSFAIVLNCGKRSQVLWDISKLGPESPAFDDPNFTLLWAGDSDGDGELDLELDLSQKYSCSRKVSFLSSRARPGELVHMQGDPPYVCGD